MKIKKKSTDSHKKLKKDTEIQLKERRQKCMRDERNIQQYY